MNGEGITANQKITFLQDFLVAVLREGKANITSYSTRIG